MRDKGSPVWAGGGGQTRGGERRSMGRHTDWLRWGSLTRPDIIMSHRVRGVPQVTRESAPDGMHTEGAMDREGKIINGGGRRDLQSSPHWVRSAVSAWY